MAKYRVEIRPGKHREKAGFWAVACHAENYIATEGGRTAEEAKAALTKKIQDQVATQAKYSVETMEIEGT